MILKCFEGEGWRVPKLLGELRLWSMLSLSILMMQAAFVGTTRIATFIKKLQAGLVEFGLETLCHAQMRRSTLGRHASASTCQAVTSPKPRFLSVAISMNDKSP